MQHQKSMEKAQRHPVYVIHSFNRYGVAIGNVANWSVIMR